jgi:hypothetical protein
VLLKNLGIKLYSTTTSLYLVIILLELLACNCMALAFSLLNNNLVVSLYICTYIYRVIYIIGALIVPRNWVRRIVNIVKVVLILVWCRTTVIFPNWCFPLLFITLIGLSGLRRSRSCVRRL